MERPDPVVFTQMIIAQMGANLLTEDEGRRLLGRSPLPDNDGQQQQATEGANVTAST